MNTRSQGFTLVELLVVMVIGGIVLGATYQTLTVQEKSSRQQIAIASTQQNTRVGLDVITNELREASATDGDIVAATSSSIQFRALRKAGVVCNRDALTAREWLDVAVLGQGFATNDTVVAFADGGNAASSRDDDWIVGTAVNQVTTPTLAGTCASMTTYTNIQRLRFPADAMTAVDVGALVRSYRTLTFQIVDANSQGYIIRTVGAGTPDTLVESLAPVSEQGLRFRYFNGAGTEINPTTAALRATIMRVEIKVVGKTMGGGAAGTREFADSLVGNLYLRGNLKTT